MRLHISPNALYEEIQGFLVILDLQTEAYYILDPVGTSMWKTLLATDTEVEALQVLENEYSIERARLKADLEAFRQRCVEQGFLQEKETERKIENPLYVDAGQPKFLVLRAWWSLFRTVRSLSASGFARTYQEYSGLPIPKDKLCRG